MTRELTYLAPAPCGCEVEWSARLSHPDASPQTSTQQPAPCTVHTTEEQK